MTILTHLVYALAYTIAGLSVGATLPALRPGTDPLTGWLTGAVVVLAGALVHEATTRMERERVAARRMAKLLDAIKVLDEEVARRKAVLEDESRRAASVGYEAMVQEVKLLQTLVAQLASRRGFRGVELRPPAIRRLSVTGRRAPRGIPDDNAPPLDDETVLEAVRDALRADRIDIYLQPIVGLPQRKPCFYELFSRVRMADGHQIMPDRYLAIAKREELIAAIDNQLLVHGVQLLREAEQRQNGAGFFVNVSAATLGDAEVMNRFLQLMAQHQPLVPKLILELSQEELREGGAATLGILSRLSRLGFRFSLDRVSDPDIDPDMLLAHEFRHVKLDRALLADPAMAPRVEALRQRLEKGHDGHGIDIIVEKIETEAQLIDVLDGGFDFGQGHLFGEPRLSLIPV